MKIVVKKWLFGAFMSGSFVYVVGMTMFGMGIVHAMFPTSEVEQFKTSVMDLSVFYPIFLSSLLANISVLYGFLFMSRVVSVAYSVPVYETWTRIVIGMVAVLVLLFLVSLFFHDWPSFVRYGTLPVALSMFGALFVSQSLVFYEVIRQRDGDFTPFQVIASVIRERR